MILVQQLVKNEIKELKEKLNLLQQEKKKLSKLEDLKYTTAMKDAGNIDLSDDKENKKEKPASGLQS